MFYKAEQMLKKARQGKHGSHPTILSRWYEQEEYRKSLAEHNINEKEIMLFDRIALERHDISATRAERLQNAKHWILRLDADGPQTPLRQRPEFAVALKQCLKMQDAHLAETRQSLRPIRPEHQQRQRQDLQFDAEKTSITTSIAKVDGGGTESHRETRRQHLHLHLHLQVRSGRLRNGKQVGAHGSLHHLRNGGDFGFLEGIAEHRRVCRQDTYSQHTSVQYSLITARTAHLRSMGYLTTVCVDRTPTNTAHTAQYSLFTSAERTHNALGSRIALSSLCA